MRVVTEAVLEHMPFDITADEMSSAFQHDRHLPDVVRQQDESDSESDDDEVSACVYICRCGVCVCICACVGECICVRVNELSVFE